MAFIVKGLVSDGTLPSTAKQNLAADIGTTGSTVRAALDAAGLGAGVSEEAVAATVTGALSPMARARGDVLVGMVDRNHAAPLAGASIGPDSPGTSTVTGTLVTGSQLLNGKARFLGGEVKTGPGWGEANSNYTNAVRAGFTSLRTDAGAQDYVLEFDYTGEKFELYMHRGGWAGYTAFEVWADGAYVGRFDGSVWSNGLPSTTYVPVTFGSAKKRRIRIIKNGYWLYGIKTATADQITAPEDPHTMPRTVLLSDSYGEGGSATRQDLRWVRYLQEALGLWDLNNRSEGGTGYLATGNTAEMRKVGDRITRDVADQNPNLVLLGMGYNDMGFATADVVTEATAVWAAIKAAEPAAALVVLGPWDTRTNAPEVELDDALAAAAKTAGVLYVSPAREGWLGHNAAYIHTDGGHVNDAGHRVLGARMSALVSELTASIPRSVGAASAVVTGGTTTPATPTILWADDFNRADAATTGTTSTGAKTWVVESAAGMTSNAVGITANRLSVQSSGNSTMVTVASNATGTFEATLADKGANAGLVVFRASTTGFYWSVEAQAAGWAVAKRVGGARTVIHQSAAVPANGDKVKVVVGATSAVVSVNGVELWSGAIDADTASVKYGFMQTNQATPTLWDDATFTTA